MKIPKVKFELSNINFDIRMIKYFIGSEYWRYFVFKHHPKIKKEKIIGYVKNYWNENRTEIIKKKEIFQREWNKINDKYIIILSKVLETDWPNKSITALVSVNPICPRFLKNWSFSIFYLKKSKSMRETVAHELLHFLYFKKWKEIFPKSKERSFDAPYLEWKLSEILAPAILNNSKIQKIIRFKATGYGIYNKTKIGNISINNHFNLLYKESLNKGESFEEFIKKAYKEIKKYKNVIK